MNYTKRFQVTMAVSLSKKLALQPKNAEESFFAKQTITPCSLPVDVHANR
jgi:hypothetical protein